MSTTLTCPRGHHWELSEADTAVTPAEGTCPVCGEPPLTVPPGVRGSTERGTDPWPSASPVALPLPIVPGYEILGELGRGGMGVVYKARQEKLKRLVALKMILAGAHAEREQLDRFRREAEAVARLQDNNIVQIYEIGEHDGRPYFSLEFVDGTSLAHRIAGTPLPSRQAAALTSTLARAVHHAHQQGIVHRDLKPANVMLTAHGMPKITDFGLAKQLDEAGRTLSGQVMGTPSYMAPEQAEGRNQEVGPAADIYALGAILYEMLTGQPPFRGPTVLDTLDQVRNREPVPPGQLQPSVPRDLELICLMCLRKEPPRRYASAAELAEELRRFLAGEPLRHTRAVSRTERLWRWSKRNRALASALTVAAVLLLATAVVSVLFAVNERRNRASLGQALQGEEEKGREAETHRQKSDYVVAEQYLDRGIQLAEKGDIGRGLHWMALALRSLPPDAGDLEHAIRTNLAGWLPCLHRLQNIYVHEKSLFDLGVSPDSRTLVAWTGGRNVWEMHLYAAATGERIGHVPVQKSHLSAWAFRPDGKVLVGVLAGVLAADGRVEMGWVKPKLQRWDTATGQAQGGPVPMGDSAYHLSLAFRTDGVPLVATNAGGESREVRVGDGATGQPAGPVLRHAQPVRDVFLSPDGKLVLTTDYGPKSKKVTSSLWEGRIGHVWVVATGKALGPPLAHEETITAAVFSPDGQTVLTGSRDLMARRWKTTTGELVGAPMKHASPLTSVAYSDDGRLFLTGTAEETKIWDAATGRRVGPGVMQSRFGGEGPARFFGPAGRTLLLSPHIGQGDAVLYDTATGQPLGQPFEPTGEVMQAAYAADGRTVLTTRTTSGAPRDERGVFRQWTPGRANGPLLTLHRPPASKSKSWSLAFHPDGRSLVTTNGGDTLRRWEVATGKDTGIRFMEHAYGFFFSPDGGTGLITGHRPGPGENNQLALRGGSLCDPLTGLSRGAPLTPDGTIRCAAFRPDGRVVLTAATDQEGAQPRGEVRLWDAVTGLPVGRSVAFAGTARAAVFRADGRLALVGADGLAWLFDGTTGEPVGEPVPHRSSVEAVAFTPDGKAFITVCDGVTQVWDTTTQRPLGEPLRVGTVLSRDGRLAAGGGRVWEIPGWRARGRPLAAGDALAFSPDGRLLLVIPTKTTVRICDTATGKPLGPPVALSNEAVWYAVFSPDGRSFVTPDGPDAHLWPVPSALEGNAERISLGLQVITGLELEPESKAFRLLEAEAWRERKRRLDKLGGPPR